MLDITNGNLEYFLRRDKAIKHTRGVINFNAFPIRVRCRLIKDLLSTAKFNLANSLNYETELVPFTCGIHFDVFCHENNFKVSFKSKL